MKMKKYLIAAALAATATGAQAQFPFPGAPMPGAAPQMPMPGRGGFGGASQGMQMQAQQMMAGIMSALNLTPEQIQQVAAIAEEARAKNTARIAAIAEEFKKIGPLFAQEDPDPAAIGAAYAKVFDLQRQAIEDSIETYKKQVAILNDEQKAKWKAMRQQMLQRVMPQVMQGMQGMQ